MSAIKQALYKLDASVRRLEAAVQSGAKPGSSQTDMFAGGKIKAGTPVNIQALSSRLDSAIGKVEKILADGTNG